MASDIADKKTHYSEMKNPGVYNPLIVAIQLAMWSLLLFLLPSSATITMILKISIWLIPVFVILRVIEGVDFFKFLKLDKRPWISLVMISSVFLFLYSLFLNNWTIQFKSISIHFFISAIAIAPIIEEIVFRGFIQQKLSAFFSPWAGIGITSIIFTIYHFPIWLSRGHSITLLACLWLLFFSILIGYFLYKSKSLWTCVSIHLIQNLIFGIMN